MLQKALLNIWKESIWCFTIFIFKSIHLEHSVTNWGKKFQGRNLEVGHTAIVKKNLKETKSIIYIGDYD